MKEAIEKIAEVFESIPSVVSLDGNRYVAEIRKRAQVILDLKQDCPECGGIEWAVHKDCKVCNGTGKAPCPLCKGKGGWTVNEDGEPFFKDCPLCKGDGFMSLLAVLAGNQESPKLSNGHSCLIGTGHYEMTRAFTTPSNGTVWCKVVIE